MLFDNERVRAELAGKEMDGRVRAIAFELDAWLIGQFGKQMHVTGVLRTPEEQARIYPDNPMKPSPHLDRPCRAIDFKRTHLTPEQLMATVSIFSRYWGKWHYKETGNPVAILLVDDRGPKYPHLHLAVYDI